MLGPRDEGVGCVKVLLLNGSPHQEGCTYTALCAIGEQLEAEGIEWEIFQMGAAPIRGCTACGHCHKSGAGECAFDGDPVNKLIRAAKDCDGFVFGSPVHYASAGGAVTSLLDRAFYAGGSQFAYKPGACVVSCRRAGTTAALDQLQKYLTISNMPVVSSRYWNMVHGNTPDEVRQDLEGMQIMRVLGRNMAWLLHSIRAGENAGVERPKPENRISTNFIR